MDGLFDWYWLGASLGLGVAAGAGRLGGWAERVLAAAALAVAVVVAVVTELWTAAGALAGLAVGVVFLRHLAREAALAATIGLALLALVPAAGYLEALAAPLLGQRLRRRAGERYAGLRILARD